MENFNADERAKVRKWQTEKTADGQLRRPWASPNNADVSNFLGTEHERAQSMDAALEAADQRFGARPSLSSFEENIAVKQFSDTARQALVREERLKDGGNPNRRISDAELQRKAVSMFLEARRKYGDR